MFIVCRMSVPMSMYVACSMFMSVSCLNSHAASRDHFAHSCVFRVLGGERARTRDRGIGARSPTFHLFTLEIYRLLVRLMRNYAAYVPPLQVMHEIVI